MPNVQPLAREELAEFESFFKFAETRDGIRARTSLYTMGRRPPILRAFASLFIVCSRAGRGRSAVQAADRDGLQRRRRLPLLPGAHGGDRGAPRHARSQESSPVFDFETSDALHAPPSAPPCGWPATLRGRAERGDAGAFRAS